MARCRRHLDSEGFLHLIQLLGNAKKRVVHAIWRLHFLAACLLTGLLKTTGLLGEILSDVQSPSSTALSPTRGLGDRSPSAKVSPGSGLIEGAQQVTLLDQTLIDFCPAFVPEPDRGYKCIAVISWGM